MSLGDFVPGQTLYYKFTTYSPSTGLPIQLAGSPVLSVYKDNSTTQSTAGITLTVDFDGVTGLNHITCDTSADGTFYSAASFFEFVITTGTLGGSSIAGAKVENFTITSTSALRPTTAARTLDVTATGAAGIDWGNVENPTTALNLSGTNIDVDQVVASVSGNVDGTIGGLTAAALADFFNTDSGDTYAGAVAGSVVKEIADNSGGAGFTVQDIVDGVWDEPLASHLIAGSTGEGLNEAATHAIAGDPWTKALPGIYSPGEAGYIVGTNIDALISSRMATYTQPTGFLSTTFSTDVASTTNITAGTITTATNVTTVSTGGITATSLSSGSLTDIAGAVWDAQLSLYQDAGSTGEALGTASAGADPWGIALPGAYTAGMAGYILGTNLNATISSVNDNINGVQEATIIRDAVNVVQFPMYLAGTDDDPAIGKTVTAQVSDGTGGYAACTGTVTEIGLGAYAFTTSIADTATESGSFMFSAAGCKNTLYPFKTSE